MARLEITTRIGCPLACTFCPQETLVSAHSSNTSPGSPDRQTRMMSIDVFQKIVDSLPPYVRIDFSGFSEPFSNPNCGEFLLYANQKPNPIAIYTTLQGASERDADILQSLVLSRRISPIVIHLPDAHGNMQGFRLSEVYKDTILKIAPLPGVELMTMSANAAVMPEVLDILQTSPSWNLISSKLPQHAFVGWTRAGSLNTQKVKGQPVHQNLTLRCAVICRMTPFYDQNVVLPNGDVALCCMDYGLKHVIGNIQEGYHKIFESSAELRKVQSANMNPLNETSICKKCHRAVPLDPCQPDLERSWKVNQG